MALIHDLDNEYGVRIIGDGGEDATKGVANIVSASATVPSLLISKTVAGSTTIAALRVAGTSAASAAVIGFGGGFISVSSILGFTATGANIAFDYVLPVEVNGVVRGIPLTSLVSLPGAATF